MRYTVDEDEKELVLHQKESFEKILLLQQKLAPVYPGISAWEVYIDTKAPESETSENAIPD